MAKRKDVVPAQKTNLPTPAALKTKLATAKTTGEVPPIITAAKALKVIAKDAKNRQAIADATEVVRRAERKLGKVMAEQKLTVGFNKGGAEKGVGRKGKKHAGLENPALPPTLAEAGIDKNLAYRARSAAEGDDEGFELDLKEELDGILNPPPTWEQRSDEKEERKAYLATPEGKAERRREKEERRREKEERERQYREQEERDRKEHPEWFEDERAEPSPVIDIVVEEVKDEPKVINIISESKKPKPVMVTLPDATEQCVVAVRVLVQNTVAEMRRGGAGEQKIRFLFQRLFDELLTIENETLPPKSVEQSVEERRAEMAKLAEADESSIQTA
jgi:hypothetical protein